MQTQAPLSPPDARDRSAVYRFFDGLSVEGKAGLNRGRNYTPLVKTFLIEHVGHFSPGHLKTPETIFNRLGVKLAPIDESFFSLSRYQRKNG